MRSAGKKINPAIESPGFISCFVYSGWLGRVSSCLGWWAIGRGRPEGLPALGLSSKLNWFRACRSYSRRWQTSQHQAGKSGTVTSSSPNQVRYVTNSRCICPAWHSRHGIVKGFGFDVIIALLLKSTIASIYSRLYHLLKFNGFAGRCQFYLSGSMHCTPE
jgi:hypothetical protein